uniref:UVR domain-containing protein n=1 Tax=Rhodosorus marinus TaxID=101924 RepID=A0A7S3EBB8_9RHOD|mmetsp:Transcript_22575/g.90471  ORF Transcript_22575/g.90471 Transcript_22575/m.90471 type:complete len:303 (+) Transcript_22575:98-1006(+)|eukprot:CAMPEP_0113969860 /NCGR_PEP_ID=MMETSP0011_2-20120614/10644_1 /TAXON_ID=101924 /ORGANISM="Rhodosorus marinus" /LENGTH=302 /DNA_ID=CAMNT_0000983749 /DNA_START=17 /DNA_END=925 /DNA_ORIENTATION=+ /assembly_acc=CAM_ASM_000156
MAFVGVGLSGHRIGEVASGRSCYRGRSFSRRAVGGVRMDMSQNDGEVPSGDLPLKNVDVDTGVGSPTGEVSRMGLLRKDMLKDMRVKYMRMQARLNRLVKEEKYLDAAKVRDDMKTVQEMDPLLKYEDRLRRLKECEKEEDYQQCILLRNEMNELRKHVPHFNLTGAWKGNQGKAQFNMEGLKLMARRTEDDKIGKKGDLLFEADLSFRSLMAPNKDERLDLMFKVIPGLKPKHFFHGRGTVIANGDRRNMAGYLVMFEGRTFEDSVCAFVFSELAVIVLFQRDRITRVEIPDILKGPARSS